MNANRSQWLIFILIALLWGGWTIAIHHVDEDAYISFRYAENLAEGQGLVYNPGVHDEGYSNLLWVLLLSFGALLGLSVPVLAPILGVIAGVVLLWLLWRLAQRLIPDKKWLSLATPAMLAVMFPLAAWAGSGLETSLFALLLFAAVFTHLRAEKSRFPWTGLWLGLAALTRPEGAAYVVVFLVHWGYCHWRKEKTGSDWRDLAIALGLVLGQLLFRQLYYGLWLPLPAYVKTGGTLPQMIDGAGYVFFWAWLRPPLILAIASIWSVIKGWKRPAVVLLVLVIAAQVAFIVYAGGDYLGYYRFLVPVLAMIVLLASLGFKELLSKTTKKWFSGIVYGFVGLFIILSLTVNIVPTLNRLNAPHHVRHNRYKLMAGEWLGEVLPPGTTIACGSAGALPYASGLPNLDIAGLCNAEAALNGEHQVVGMAGHHHVYPKLIGKYLPSVVLISSNPMPWGDVTEWLAGQTATPGYAFEQLSFPNQSVLLDPALSKNYQSMYVELANELYLAFYALHGETVDCLLNSGAVSVELPELR